MAWLKIPLNLLVFILAVACPQLAKAACPSGWTYRDGFCYVYVEGNYLHREAADACVRRGAFIVDIQSAEENSFLRSLRPPNSPHVAWIGYNDRLQEGRFVWDRTGTSGRYTNWGRGEPNNADGEDCTMWHSQSLFWNDVPCRDAKNVRMPVICKKVDIPPPTSPPTSPPPLSCPSGWTLRDGFCYVWETSKRLYTEAAEACRQKDSFLVDIQSAEENRFIETLRPQGESSVAIWIGYNDRVQEGHFVWERTKTPGSYSNWASGEPTNGREDCTMWFSPRASIRQLQWNDIPCGTSWMPSVCKKTAIALPEIQVECSTMKMTVTIRKDVFGSAPASEIFLNDGVCKVSGSGQTYELSWGLKECGNAVSYSRNKTVYSNVIAHRAAPLISRSNEKSVLVKCTFDNTAQVNADGPVQPMFDTVQLSEEGFGKYNLTYNIMEDGTYSNAVSRYPKAVKVGENIYMMVQVKSSDHQLDIYGVRCFATLEPSPSSTPQYTFLQDDCPVDKTVFKIPQNETDVVKFGIKAFRFVGVQETQFLYTHCTVAVCQKDAADNICRRGCVQVPGRAKRGANNYPGASSFHTVSRGPFQLQDTDSTSGAPSVSMTAMTVLITALTMLTLLF